ncbi:MAG: GAF domain-containing protein [Myxococcaceae bacterium]|nr:GAF domain-containing protein [Myxococcaceae bacterium]
MDIRTQSALLAAIVGLAIGIAVLLRSVRPRVLTLFGLFAISTALFHLSKFLEGLFPWDDGSLAGRLILGATILTGAIVPSTALSFFLEFLNFSPRAARRGRRASLISVLLGLAVAASPLAELLAARVAVSVWVLLALGFSVSLLLSRMRASESRIDRLRLAYLAIGAGAAVLFTGLDFLTRFDVPFPVLGPIVSTLYLFFLSQTLLRLRLMDLHELLGKIASQTVLAVLLAVVFVVLTGWVKDAAGLFLFNTVVAAFVMLILLEPVRDKVDERVVAFFFRERFDFLQAMRALRARTANLIDVPELSTRLLDGLNETRRVTHASVYLLAEERPGFRLLDSRGPQPAPFLDAGTARALVSRTEKAQLFETVERRIVELRTQPTDLRRTRDELRRMTDVKGAMEQMKAGITVPLMGNDRVIGFFNLLDERVPEAFASDEIALILELAEHLASVIENSKLYDRMRERDRLAALGEMSAGLAHEIRNPLGAIKGAAQCLDPSKLPGEDGEFLEVIVEEVNRLNGVVSAFLDYARPLKQSFAPTDVNEVVTRTVRLIQNEMPASLTLEAQLADGLPRVDGDAEQLKQVLINLVQNALQAIGDKPGKIVLRTQRPDRFSEARGAESVELLVIDDGPGIPADQQPHIFVPFFTTKSKGTGLGLAICQRIVRGHGGSIVVQSRPGDGTSFVIRLPALASEAPPVETPSPEVEHTPVPGATQPPLPEADDAEPSESAPEKPEGRPSRRERRRRKAS